MIETANLWKDEQSGGWVPTRQIGVVDYLRTMPKFEFCIPTVGKAVPTSAEWFHEVKYDGYRLRVERVGDVSG